MEEQALEIYSNFLIINKLHLITNNSTNPFFNLAVEENLLKKSGEDFFMLWQNEPTLVVGCNQNTAAEVDVQKAKAQGVHIVRRITGGGAVYHDLGNLNFSLIKTGVSTGNLSHEIYAELSRPVIAALAQMGVKAELGGRNDILVDGRKISGCAMHGFGNRTLLHGALLFSTNLTALSGLLTPHDKKFEGKAIKSVSSRVANVADFLAKPFSIDDFKERIATNIENKTARNLSAKELDNAQLLAHTKYETDEWNFGKLLAHTFAKHEKTTAGNVDVRMSFSGGHIEHIRFFGDFFSEKEVAHLEELLCGCLYAPGAIQEKLSNINVSQYICGLSANEFMELLF